ncbi:hypothetical protein EDEG_01563 [Edhazardia aedis USNM 41457]|uniref:Uncharacterized protein n=1 Tax=Edhazardia aedis (strain USNM 41457) TaxID=1003232 RepID=J9DS56_EDHAE|nr:hypothetical protein EDEG_01563 [Edhazardia aedis USNM 41457]|eukprot:EJW04127.1 hypothetical protein EDEG_01563 [Edhazardia aedis USNM 41457]
MTMVNIIFLKTKHCICNRCIILISIRYKTSFSYINALIYSRNIRRQKEEYLITEIVTIFMKYQSLNKSLTLYLKDFSFILTNQIRYSVVWNHRTRNNITIKFHFHCLKHKSVRKKV